MARAIVIVGGLSDETSRDKLLSGLRERAPDIEWEWIKPDTPSFNLPPKPFRRLFSRLQGPGSSRPTVVKLYRLHGREAHQLYSVCADPVEVPSGVETGGALLEWVLSRDANLVPRREWFANKTEAALVAILAKLIRNKSWNKDVHGHQWTKEDDLLGQAPVRRSECPEIAREAGTLLPRLDGLLLLSKGAKQGKTPKEWSIKLTALVGVKRCIIEQSLDALKALPNLAPLVDRCARDCNRCFRVDSLIVSERIRQVCADTRESTEGQTLDDGGAS